MMDISGLNRLRCTMSSRWSGTFRPTISYDRSTGSWSSMDSGGR